MFQKQTLRNTYNNFSSFYKVLTSFNGHHYSENKNTEVILNYFGSIYNSNVPIIEYIKEEIVSLVYGNAISIREMALENTDFTKIIAKACNYPVKIKEKN